jgi:hypothetical protein
MNKDTINSKNSKNNKSIENTYKKEYIDKNVQSYNQSLENN